MGFGLVTMNNEPVTAKIGTRTFTFTAEAVARSSAAADMIARGWEPTYYLGSGVRGAKFLAYRSRRTGEFVRVCKL